MPGHNHPALNCPFARAPPAFFISQFPSFLKFTSKPLRKIANLLGPLPHFPCMLRWKHSGYEMSYQVGTSQGPNFCKNILCFSPNEEAHTQSALRCWVSLQVEPQTPGCQGARWLSLASSRGWKQLLLYQPLFLLANCGSVYTQLWFEVPTGSSHLHRQPFISIPYKLFLISAC